MRTFTYRWTGLKPGIQVFNHGLHMGETVLLGDLNGQHQKVEIRHLERVGVNSILKNGIPQTRSVQKSKDGEDADSEKRVPYISVPPKRLGRDELDLNTILVRICTKWCTPIDLPAERTVQRLLGEVALFATVKNPYPPELRRPAPRQKRSPLIAGVNKHTKQRRRPIVRPGQGPRSPSGGWVDALFTMHLGSTIMIYHPHSNYVRPLALYFFDNMDGPELMLADAFISRFFQSKPTPATEAAVSLEETTDPHPRPNHD